MWWTTPRFLFILHFKVLLQLSPLPIPFGKRPKLLGKLSLRSKVMGVIRAKMPRLRKSSSECGLTLAAGEAIDVGPLMLYRFACWFPDLALNDLHLFFLSIW